MKKKNFLKIIYFLAATSMFILSCTQHKDEIADTNSPKFHITESEKLTIPEAIALPENLPNGNSRVLTFFAIGVQKYKAAEVPGSNPIAFTWAFVAPQADLYDITNQKVGTHSQGPTWQLSMLDSMYGQSFSPPKSAVSPDQNSVDWLLLMPKNGKPPTGAFAGVDYLQRIDTRGGKAPLADPTEATQTIEVPYTAIYRFSKKAP